MNKTEILQELYRDEIQPVWILKEDFRVFWANQAAAEQFPNILEGMDLSRKFSGISFNGLKELDRRAFPAVLHAQNSAEQLTVSVFGEKSRVYAAIWSGNRTYRLDREDHASAEGVELMNAWLREGVFRIFNHLERLNYSMECCGITEGVDSVGRIERNCQQLLRLGCNLDGYYGGTGTAGELPQEVAMTEYLEEIFRETDFYLEVLGLRLVRSVRSGGAFCRICKRRFTAALLNLIDLSAAYAPKNGEMRIELRCTKEDFCLEFRDTHTPSDLLDGGADGLVELIPRGRSNLQLPRVSLGFLDRVVQESGGRYLADTKEGLHVSIRLPLVDADIPMRVEDAPVYTVKYRGRNKSSLVGIMLSDLAGEKE